MDVGSKMHVLCLGAYRNPCDTDLQLKLELPDRLEEALVVGPVVLLRFVGLDDSPPAVDHDPIHPCCLEHPELLHQLVGIDDFTIGTHHIELQGTDAELEKVIPHLKQQLLEMQVESVKFTGSMT
jgi:hypothetical protein